MKDNLDLFQLQRLIQEVLISVSKANHRGQQVLRRKVSSLLGPRFDALLLGNTLCKGIYQSNIYYVILIVVLQADDADFKGTTSNFCRGANSVAK